MAVGHSDHAFKRDTRDSGLYYNMTFMLYIHGQIVKNVKFSPVRGNQYRSSVIDYWQG